MIRRRSVVLLVAVCALALLAGVFHTQILFSMGQMLVKSEPPVHADAALVLGGDYRGGRIVKGAEMYKLGFVPRVLVSGGGGFYGWHESQLAIDFAVKQGYSREIFVPLPYPALSTESELKGMAATLRVMGIRKLLLVTGPSHSRRAARVAHNIIPGIEIHSVDSVDPHWRDGYWWRDREGRKTWLLEVVKSITYTFGM